MAALQERGFTSPTDQRLVSLDNQIYPSVPAEAHQAQSNEGLRYTIVTWWTLGPKTEMLPGYKLRCGQDLQQIAEMATAMNASFVCTFLAADFMGLVLW